MAQEITLYEHILSLGLRLLNQNVNPKFMPISTKRRQISHIPFSQNEKHLLIGKIYQTSNLKYNCMMHEYLNSIKKRKLLN